MKYTPIPKSWRKPNFSSEGAIIMISQPLNNCRTANESSSIITAIGILGLEMRQLAIVICIPLAA